jgi:hypothetical protein
MIDELIGQALAEFDLTEAGHQESVLDLAEAFLGEEDVEALRGWIRERLDGGVGTILRRSSGQATGHE